MRKTIKTDVLTFGLPATLVLVAGMSLSGYDVVRRQLSLGTYLLSTHGVVGLTQIVGGLALMVTAQVTLWRFYSATLVIREGHEPITRGPYRLVRHPIYLGALVGIMGPPVYVGSVKGLVVMLALIPCILGRIRREEAMLTEEFGDAYRAYAASTRKLIPLVY